MNHQMENGVLMKKSYSKYALSAAIYLITVVAVQLLIIRVIGKFLPESFTGGSVFTFLFGLIIPEYVIGFPVLTLIVRKMDKKTPEKNKLGFMGFAVCFLLCCGLCGTGTVVGFIVNRVLTLPFGVSANNSNLLANLMLGSAPFWRILTIGILAPIFEELIFRKFLIDRTVKYGEWVAIISSALMFGLFHGNFSQFFYATGMGAVFAYVYIRTGKVWYSIVYHMIFNLSASIIGVGLAGLIDFDKVAEMSDMAQKVASNPADTALQAEYTKILGEVIPTILPYYGWMGLCFVMTLIGIVIWIIVLVKKKIVIKKSEAQVEKGMKFAWGNIGMIIFILATLGLFVYNYLGMILNA